jgi:hypothetical protein
VIHIPLKCPETRRLRKYLLSRKWQIINEELAYKKIMNCTNTVKLRNLVRYLYEINLNVNGKIELRNFMLDGEYIYRTN